MYLIKSHVRGYVRHTASGAAVQVREHEDARHAFDKMHVAYHLTANRDKIEKEGFKAGKGNGIGGDTSHIYTSDDPKYLQDLADHLNTVRQILRSKQHTKAAMEYTGHNKESMALVRQMMGLYAKRLGRPLTPKEETSVIAFQGPFMKYAEIKPKFGKDLADFIRGNKYEVVRTRARNEVGRSDIMGGERAYREGDVFLDDIKHFQQHDKLRKSRHAAPGGEDGNGKHYRGCEFVPNDTGAVPIPIPEHMRGMDDNEFISEIPPQSDDRKIKKAIPHLYLLRKADRTLDGRINFNGLPISVETGRSRSRAWRNPHDGTEGISRMWLPYGYIRGTLGTDGNAIDVFVGPNREAKNVYIIHISKAPDFTEYDEDKVFLGLDSPEEAKRFFFISYNDPRFFRDMTVMPFDEFKKKALASSGTILKSHIREYQRRTPSGGITRVREHDDRRTHHNPDAPVGEFGAIPQEVAEAAGIPAAPIRLLRGKQLGNHRGFGLEHIAVQHGNQIRQAGYRSEEDFIKDVTENFNAIYDVGNGKLALVADGGTEQKIHIVQVRYQQGQKFYTVVTGYIADRPKFTEQRHRLLWRRILKAMQTGMLRKSGEEICKRIGDSLGVDWKKYDLDEFCNGMFVEEEHRDVTHGDPVKTAKIVLAHLDEDPRYYSKLARIEKAVTPYIYLLKKRSR